jgi:enoyl-CoA hydratase/carnithine racemase
MNVYFLDLNKTALSREALTEIASVLDELRNDDQISVVLTTGAGDHAYCAGRDLKESHYHRAAIAPVEQTRVAGAVVR